MFHIRDDWSCYPDSVGFTDVINSFNLFGFLKSSAPELQQIPETRLKWKLNMFIMFMLRLYKMKSENYSLFV